MSMRISLVIPAYNEEGFIGDCLESVAPLAEQFCEVIVVDNASADKTAEVASRYPFVSVVSEDTKGLTRARECGFRHSTGDIVAYIDADSRIYPAWPAYIRDVFTARPDAVSLSGPARYHDVNAWRRLILSGAWWISAPLIYRVTGYMIFGAAFAVRRSALEAIGGFNRSIEFYGEDTDLARRLHTQGKVLFHMNFYILTSARRFISEGILRANIVYGLNFLWPALFHRPFSTTHKDVRSRS